MASTSNTRHDSEIAQLRARVAALEAELATQGTGTQTAQGESVDDLDLLLDCRHVLDLVQDSVIAVDKNGKVLMWNKGAERIYGYTAEEAVGQPIRFLYPPEEGNTAERVIIPKVLAEGTYTTTRRLVRKDGSEIYIDVRLGALRNQQGETIGIVGCSNDVTSRKLHEEGSLASIVQSIPDGVIVVDRQGRFRMFNPAAKKLIGPGTTDDVAGEWTAVQYFYLPGTDTPFPPEQLPLLRALQGDAVHAVEIEIRKPDQQSSLISVNASPLRDFTGAITGGIAVFRDITVARRLEEEREMTQFAVDRAGDSMFWLQTDGSIHKANTAACKRLGYTFEELTSLRVSDIDPTVCPEDWPTRWQDVLEKGSITFESHHQTHSGEVYPVEITASHFRFHDQSMICAIARDIGQRKEADRQLRESEERFRTTFEQAAVGIAHVSTKGKFLRVNGKLCEILGYSREELLGLTFQEITHPDDLSADLGQLDNMLADKTGNYTTEKRYICRDGSYLWVHLTVTLLSDEAGQPKYFISVMEDISVRKRAEEQLQVEERLLRGLLDLQERERRTISYEIHDGFLQYVVGAHMILESALSGKSLNAAKLLPHLRQISGYLKQAIDEGRRMIGDLRALLIDEVGVVEAVEHLTSDENFCQGLEVTLVQQVNFDRLEPMLETAIFRIVQEALTNVKRHAQTNQAVVTLRQKHGPIRIEVVDKGVGFEPNAIPANRYGVRGICQRARLFGGWAEVYSAPGRGTRVVAELPLTPPSSNGNGNVPESQP